MLNAELKGLLDTDIHSYLNKIPHSAIGISNSAIKEAVKFMAFCVLVNVHFTTTLFCYAVIINMLRMFI
jgi:hypothetical protein